MTSDILPAMMRRAFACALRLPLLLAACAGAPTAPAEPRTFTVQSVEVRAVEGAGNGRYEDQAQRDAALQALQSALTTQLAQVQGGSIPAKANVTVTSMSLRSAIVTGPTGEVLDQQQIRYADQARNNGSTINGIPVGLLINAAVNASKSGKGEDQQSLVDGFAAQVAAWLRG